MGWIGVDFDGTLAEYRGGFSPTSLGQPIPKMVARVKAWLAEGKEVRIFTARVCAESQSAIGSDEQRQLIESWCEQNLGQRLTVTCVKDFAMIRLYDDRCVQVKTNTGELIE